MSITTILYVGNKLSKHGNSLSAIDTLGPQLESLGYEVIYTSDKKYQILRLFDMVCSVIKSQKKVSYVLIDTYSYLGFWYAVIIGRLCQYLKIKYVPILHGGNLPLRLNRSPKCAKTLFSKSYINIAPSRYLLEAFEQHGFYSIYIPNNIDISNYSFKNRSVLTPNLLYVRSFDAIYNPTMAIKVMKELVDLGINANLCMVGPDKDGSLQKCIDLVHNYKLNDRVKFTGVLSKKDWHKLSEDYDIFINTTNIDNTPISVIEAMALGLPVVSTNVGGIPFLLKNNENAILVEKQNTKEMVDAIKALLADQTLANKLSVNGRLKAESFDWHSVKGKWLKLIADND